MGLLDVCLRLLQLLVLYPLLILRVNLGIIWISLNNWVALRLEGRGSRGAAAQRVVIIGDGLALGYGDWVRLGQLAGVAGRLEKRFGKEPLRLNWSVQNRGHFGATSGDWLPDSASRPRHCGWWCCVRRSLFGDIFGDRRGGSAAAAPAIVVVAVGAMDVRRGFPPAYTARNVEAIVRELTARGSIVVVAGVPNIIAQEGELEDAVNIISSGGESGGDPLVQDKDERNRLIRDFLAQMLEEEEEKGEGKGGESKKEAGGSGGSPGRLPKVVAGPHLDDPSYGEYECRAWDHVHISTKGYDAFGERLGDQLVPLLRKTEWHFLQSRFLETDDAANLAAAAADDDADADGPGEKDPLLKKKE